MSDAKEQAAWFRCFVVTQRVAASGFSGKRVMPHEVIPERYLPDELKPSAKSVQQRQRIANDLGWAYLEQGLRRHRPA